VPDDLAILDTLFAKRVFQLVDLVAVMEVLDGLFEADGDEESDDDGGDVKLRRRATSWRRDAADARRAWMRAPVRAWRVFQRC
jgi:hypothetical protein